MSTFRLERAFSPKSVAVIGGSRRPSSLGAAVLKNLQAGGFKGPIVAINPHYHEVGGQPAYRNLSTVPFTPDLVVITSPAPTIPGIVAEAGARRAAREARLRLIGPNCLGVMMPRAKLNASFAAHRPNEGHLALISQSGAIASAMVGWAAERAVGFSGIVSIGDQIDVDVADMLDYFALDEHTRAILLYIEEVKDARKFMSAARAAARLKPVIAVKSGRMAQGARAAATHTGALAGSDAVYDAAFRRAGILRVFDLHDLFDCAELLSRGRAPRGNRLMILTNGGGLGILAIDQLVELGGVVAPLDPETIARLDKVLPRWSRGNPVDIGGDADAGRYTAGVEVLFDDPDCDAVLVMNVETAMAPADDIAKAIAERADMER